MAHDNQFKNQQAERIRAIRSGQVPPASGEIDHSSAEVYRGYSTQRPDQVLAECLRVTAELLPGHDQPERAIALQEQGVAAARYLGAPAAAAGMAGYSLACAQAKSGSRTWRSAPWPRPSRPTRT